MSKVNLGVCICCHDDSSYLAHAISAAKAAGPVTVFVSRQPWGNAPVGNWGRSKEIAESAGATVVVCDHPHESVARRFSIMEMRRLKFSHAITIDSDEVLEPELLASLVNIAKGRLAERVCCTMETYWKSVEYHIRPREALTPIVLIDLQNVKHVKIREYEGGRKLVLGPEFGLMHHLSYCGGNERILAKINSWSHKAEVIPGWYEQKWLNWNDNAMIRDLHPTHPQAYHKTERIKPPAVLAGIPVEPREEIVPCMRWPSVSVVIPLYGGPEDIRLCLQSLNAMRDLVDEIVVVDDASPDRAPKVVETFEDVKLIRNPENLGFAASCNAGYAETTGKVIIFLNSDTVVSREALVRLVESLMSSRNIAAAGPQANNTGHHQQIPSTYESLENMPLFADDVARMEIDDSDVDMLVGFCLAIKRDVLDEVGLFDTRFGSGMFEDNDICYRLRRAGYRLVLSRRSFIHHTGSRSLARLKEHPAALLARNQRVFLDKWKDDLECGFVKHLSGLSSEPIVFDSSRSPEAVDSRIRRLARKADITLAMIVKNEERCLKQCLESTRGAFKIVIVDTGSTDRTIEIAKERGAEVHQMVWPDSFSVARNKSLSYVRSYWVLWVDADDELDRSTVELILQTAIRHRNAKVAFMIPVRFVDQGPTGGTQVDHIKLFPTLPGPGLPGFTFTGHVHEQILGSLRDGGVEIARIKGALVRHSGYDVSATGQSVKREREKKLLLLDYEEDPSNPFFSFNLGMTASFLGAHEEAVGWLEKCLELAGPNESIVKNAYALLGSSKRELGDTEGALAAFDKGLEHNPAYPDLLFRSAMLLTALGRLDEAKARYVRISTEMPEEISSFDVGILTFKRYHNLAEICMMQGSYTQARDWWRQAIAAAPGFAPAAHALFDTAVVSGDIHTAKEALDAVRGAEGTSEAWANRLCKFAESTGQAPEHALRGFIQHNPYAMGPLMALARILIGRGDISGAAPLLHELDRLGSAEAAYMRGTHALSRLDFWAALEHMNRSNELNPANEKAQTHLAELRRVLTLEMPPELEVKGSDVLVGPRIGGLGVATCRFSVVVVTFNSVSTISECVERVLSTMGQEDELILVDNASTDGTEHLLDGFAESDARVRLILNEENLGYSKAVNVGLLSSKGEFLVLLNPDAYVHPGWLESMSACLGGDVAAVGPMADNTGGDQFVGHILDGRHPPVEELAALLKSDFAGKTEETKFLVGICVMVRRETLDKHGMLDEGTELGADDLELSWRLRMLGYRLVIAHDVFVQHDQGVSFSSLPRAERVKRQARSDASLIRKLEAYYGKGGVPTSMELWGTSIFDEALFRVWLLDLGDAE